jgi:hypothetical protein
MQMRVARTMNDASANTIAHQDRNSQPISGSSRSIRPFWLLWAAYLLVMELASVSLLLPSGLAQRMDFRCLYAGGVLVRTDPASLYDPARQKQVEDGFVSRSSGLLPFVRPPYEALLFAPFSLVSYRAGYLYFMAFNCLLIPLCFFLLRPVFSRTDVPWQPRPGFMFFAFLPTAIAIVQGQDSILFLLLCCLTYRELTRGQQFRAGCFLALSLFKFQLALPLAFLLAVRHGRRFLAGFVLGAAIVATVSLLVVGWSGVALFRQLLVTISLAGASTNGAISAVAPSSMPNIRGLLYFVAGRYLLPTPLFALVVSLSLGIVGWAARFARGTLGDDPAFALSVVSALLVSYHLHLHDMTALLLPIAMVGGREYGVVSKTCWLFFLLPPILLLMGRDAISLLSLVLLAFGFVISWQARTAVASIA